MKPVTIAIDGPAASGKSTVACSLARELGYLYLDTGVMYRAVTWAVLERRIPVGDEQAVAALASHLRIDVGPPSVDDGRQYTVLVDGTDITWAIRLPRVSASVSSVAAYPGVRKTLVSKQRRMAAQGPVVMVGRDIGTVVLLHADLKIYLDASPEERARRRLSELQARGERVEYGEVLASMRRRDEIDSHRAASPLRVAEDAVVVDTTHVKVHEVLVILKRLVEDRGCPQE